MNKTSLVLRTVLATLCIEAVIALMVVLYITGGKVEFGSIMSRDAGQRQVRKLDNVGMTSQVPVYRYENVKIWERTSEAPFVQTKWTYFLTDNNSNYAKGTNWKLLECGPHKEWVKKNSKRVTKGVPEMKWEYEGAEFNPRSHPVYEVWIKMCD